nr:hypothetical protein [Anaerolineae bacterium]
MTDKTPLEFIRPPEDIRFRRYTGAAYYFAYPDGAKFADFAAETGEADSPLRLVYDLDPDTRIRVNIQHLGDGISAEEMASHAYSGEIERSEGDDEPEEADPGDLFGDNDPEEPGSPAPSTMEREQSEDDPAPVGRYAVEPFPFTTRFASGWRHRRVFWDPAYPPLVIDEAFIDTEIGLFQMRFAAAPAVYDRARWVFDALVQTFALEEG